MRIPFYLILSVVCAAAMPLASCTLCSGDKKEESSARAKAEARARKAKRKRARPRRLQTRKVTVGEAKRSYLVQRPGRRSKRTPPALIMLHDSKRSARDFARRSDLRSGARKLGYILAVPSAGRDGWGPGLCREDVGRQNPGAEEKVKAAAKVKGATGTAKAAGAAKAGKPPESKKAAGAQDKAKASGEVQLADFDYLQAILDDLTGKLRADPKRIYLLGTGAGAAFAQAAVSRMPGRFAGVVLVSPKGQCIDSKLEIPPQPIPALLMTGPAASASSAGQASGAAPAAVAGLDFWLKANKCTPQPTSEKGRVTTHEYSCQNGKVVHVQEKSQLRRWPKKVGRTYSLRYVHNFFRR